MAILVILVLIGLWAAVLVPPILRSRSSGGHLGVSDFMDGLRSLGHRGHGAGHRGHGSRSPGLGGPVLHGPVTGPPPTASSRQPLAPPMAYRPMPGGISPMQRRRMNVLTVLGAATGLTFLFALMARTPLFILLFLVCASALGGYCYLLVQMKNRAQAARPAPAPAPRAYRPPVEREADVPRQDNVIVLRRSVG